ncbi:DNA/RNA non-specific endonuclease [Muricauda sp. JGD-17]|uniref:Endonuclease n=1 Tax=Flagellimonas ochracea TaxID=2696472 RepID=A0A964TDS2_9FLAO|nr:DNA/RNA non-specific endonuclease [Allomuricauda ochracea]NAY92133.1 DNA/RNA non-specific endonuclease [Allomuricauda ochracea]
MKNKILYTLLFIICVVGFWIFENFYTPSEYTDPNNARATEVATNLLPSSTTGAVVKHQHYILSYNEPYEQAEWVAYRLEKTHLTHDDRERPHFIEDPYLKTKSSDWRNYRGSGYDRGHLCPAGDRRFSEYAYNETFYTSNIAPQDSDFNAGIWNRLEQQVRYWCKKYGGITIITGGVLEEGLEEIGEEDVDVPEAFYKIVIRGNGSSAKIVAFLIPHRESSKTLSSFLVSVDEIERVTGINFFEKQPRSWQEKFESEILSKDWKF